MIVFLETLFDRGISCKIALHEFYKQVHEELPIMWIN